MRFRFVLVAQIILVYSNVIAQRTALPTSLSELLRKRAKQSFGGEIPPYPSELKTHHFFDREMLEQCHNVGKAFMKSEDINVGRLFVAPVQSIKQRMRHFMGDDVA